MKKIFFLICFLTVPLVGYAKYCPNCFETFQVQTTHGQAKLLYQWLMKAMDPRYPLKKQNIRYLFSKSVTISMNGSRVARGYAGVYQYLINRRRHEPLLEFKLQQFIVDQNKASIAYQTVFMKKGHRYRSLVIAMLAFKEHKLIQWWGVSYTTRI